MADRVVCPVCGESNPGDMEFCRNCQSRLRPVEGASEAIQPGQLPTKKTTSELEPLLPQWLREARQKSREPQAQEPDMPEQQAAEEPEPSGSDLLAGLASQSSDEEDEIPDWLAQITGAQTKKKKPVPEDNQVKWVELGRGDEPAQDAEGQTATAEPQADELGDWFKQATASSTAADFQMPAARPEEAPPETPQPAEPEDLSWLTRLDAAVAPPTDENKPAEEAAASAPAAFEETPDWLKNLQAEQTPSPEPQGSQARTPPQGHVPDWLKSFGEEIPVAEPAEAAAPEEPAQDEPVFQADLPDWLKSAEPTTAKPSQVFNAEPAQEEATLAPVELPDWISALGSSQPQESAAAEPVQEEAAAPVELPDWISALGGSQGQAPTEEVRKEEETPIPPAIEPEQPVVAVPQPAGALPDWLSSLRAEQEITPPSTTPEAEEPADETPEPSATLPEWFSALRAEQEATPPSPTLEPEKPAEEIVEPGAALTGEDADAIFASMQTPDWLSAVLPTSTPTEGNVPAAAAAEEEPIVPAELPSWVQAMRPVEAAMGATPSATEDVATEARGPLAGLHGVLPVIPGAAVPSSKPKAHSIKLVATEQQQAHAALLEKILAAETAPVPMRSASPLLRSQRVLRWALSMLLIVVLGGVVFARTEIFQLPSGVPNETVAAIDAVESIPEGAPVLLIFDYQPATVGEMEASGASLVDHMIILRHPHLALLSTSPTGPALAERFMSTVIADNEGRAKYTRGVDYVDLGFLPGGLAGVRSFAENPSTTVPFEAGTRGAQPVWGTGVLTHVEHYSDFAAVIVLTDSVDSGRTWVEQTQETRGNSLLVFVTSAQAGPMLLPYEDSGQVNGMVSGIYGAVGAEQRNAGSPAIYGLPGGSQPNARPTGYVRRYWDAYSVGLYLAVAAIVLGSLVSLGLGLWNRRANAVG